MSNHFSFALSLGGGMFHLLSRVTREWGGRVSAEHTAHQHVSRGRKWCHAPWAPWNVLDTILLSTQNTTLAKDAPGFDWYLVHFDGAWIKCANKFSVLSTGAIYCSDRLQRLLFETSWGILSRLSSVQLQEGQLSERWSHALAFIMSFPTWMDTFPFVNYVRYVTGTSYFRKEGYN